VQAAFFDLDKTVIAKSSVMAFARPLRRDGLLGRKAFARGAWTQVLYVRFGADAKRMARIQASALAITTGWSQARVREIVAEHLVDAIDPITHLEAVDLIRTHREAGRRVYLVSAAPEEMVEPIGTHLGVDGVIATRAKLDDAGCYAGELACYAYGPVKASLMAEVAAREGIDLAASWAYSDSITDAPMLEAVGHPVAVNPDRALRRLAAANGWPIVRFRTARGPVPEAPGPVGSESVTDEGTPLPGHRRGAALASTVAVLTTCGGATAWWWRRRSQGPQLEPRRA
jgi:HAD superfamily hydrolase (TIGR01490 family)